MLKQKVVVYFPNSKLGFRDLKSSSLLDFFEDKFSVKWLFTDEHQKTFFNKEISYKVLNNGKIRNFIWSILFEIKSFEYYKFKINESQPFPFLGMGLIKTLIIKFIYLLRIRKFVGSLLYFLLSIKKLNPNIFQYNDYKAVICFTSSKDLLYDDLIRFTKKNNIKSILVLINWDNATSKPYLEKPNLVLTWGKQTSKLSNYIHGIQSKEVGSPRFESYKYKPAFGKKVSFKKLNLSSKHDYIIFAGASFPSEEVKILNILSEIIVKKYNSKFKIIYRKHPYSWNINNISSNNYFEKIVISDPTLSKFKSEDFNQFRHLFNVSSALISPYSTMIVESLLNKKPVLALGINYDNKFNWKLAANIAPHLRILHETDCIIHCYSEKKLAISFENLINRIRYDNVHNSYDEITNQILCLKKEKYEKKIFKEINKVINL